MKTLKLITSGFVFAISIFGSINCPAEDEASKSIIKKIQDKLGNLIFQASPYGPTLGHMNSPDGRKQTENAYNNILGNHGNQGTLTQARNNTDNLDAKPQPSGKYYEDPRLDPADQAKLRELQQKLETDPEVADNTRRQINHVLLGTGVESPYSDTRETVKGTVRDATSSAVDAARPGHVDINRPEPVHIDHSCPDGH